MLHLLRNLIYGLQLYKGLITISKDNFYDHLNLLCMNTKWNIKWRSSLTLFFRSKSKSILRKFPFMQNLAKIIKGEFSN